MTQNRGEAGQQIQVQSPFLKELVARGLMYQTTLLEKLDQHFMKGPVTLYVGFDATAESLHVGHLMWMMLMRLAQRHGHCPIIVVGGGTTKLGDPSFKDKTRPLLDPENIQKNIGSMSQILTRYIQVTGENCAKIVNNDGWLSSLNYLDFLRDYGRYFSVNRMLTFEGVKQRLERQQSLTFLEFNYMILQAYDFLVLQQEYQCTVQIGGADQWGNIINGVELIHKALGKEAHAITYPLLTTASGAKMGKSEKGAVWLNKDLLSDFDFWQFWRNVEDQDVVRFLKIFTDLPVEETERLSNEKTINDLKVVLADHVTSLARGGESLAQIHQSAFQAFRAGEIKIKADGHDAQGNPILMTGFPITKIDKHLFEEEGVGLVDFLAMLDTTRSKSDVRKLIRAGAVSLNGEKIETESTLVDATYVQSPGFIKVSIGKKNHRIVQLWISEKEAGQ